VTNAGRRIGNLGAIKLVLQAMKKFMDHPDVQEYGISLLQNLAIHGELHQHSVEFLNFHRTKWK
jgi:hypothetical protein